MHRDGHCHEAVMWYVHHLTEDVKQLIGQSRIMVPQLAVSRHDCPEDADNDHKKVCSSYDYQVSCFDCHSNTLPDHKK